MKKQMLTLVIGILIGAIITTGVFLVLKNSDSSSDDTSSETTMEGGRGNMERDGNMMKDENFVRDENMTLPDDASGDLTTNETVE